MNNRNMQTKLLIFNKFAEISSSINLNKYLSGQLKEDGMYTPGSIVITCSQTKKEQTVI
jgi:hypothetical protein